MFGTLLHTTTQNRLTSAIDFLMRYARLSGASVSILRSDRPSVRKARKFVLKTFPYSIIYVNARAEIVIVAVAGHARRTSYWRNRLPVM